jgi:hypothetical protein
VCAAVTPRRWRNLAKSGRRRIGRFRRRIAGRIATSETTVPATHDASTAGALRVTANITAIPRNSSLESEKMVFRASCTPPAISPIRPWSRTKLMLVTTAPTVNSTTAVGLPTYFSMSTPSMDDATNSRASTSADTPQAISAAGMSPLLERLLPSAMSRVPNPSIPIVPKRVIAETAAEAWPTSETAKVRAARIQ